MAVAELVAAELAMLAELDVAMLAALLQHAAHRPETACSTAASAEQSRASSVAEMVADVPRLLQAADVLLLQAAVASSVVV